MKPEDKLQHLSKLPKT